VRLDQIEIESQSGLKTYDYVPITPESLDRVKGLDKGAGGAKEGAGSSAQAAKVGNSANASSGMSKDTIVNALDGKTLQSSKIAEGIKSGKIKVNVLGDELFERSLGVDKTVTAVQRGEQIYLRRSSGTILSDAVHEGTHVLDFRNNFGSSGLSSWSWEKRAFFYERQYQLSTGRATDFQTIDDMLTHIWGNYENRIYDPYSVWGGTK